MYSVFAFSWGEGNESTLLCEAGLYICIISAAFAAIYDVYDGAHRRKVRGQRAGGSVERQCGGGGRDESLNKARRSYVDVPHGGLVDRYWINVKRISVVTPDIL